MALASPIAAPPPTATSPSALAARAALSPASATAFGTCRPACACRPAARAPSRSTTLWPSRAPLPGVATTSAWQNASRSASSAARARAPEANMTRWDETSWMKEIMRTAPSPLRGGLGWGSGGKSRQCRTNKCVAAGASPHDPHPCPSPQGGGEKSFPLAPNPKRFLGRAVGDREQHRLLRRDVVVALPRRHDEHVVRTPLEHLAVDLGVAFAFDADEDGAVRRAVRLTLKALRQHGEPGRHGRQHRA